MPVFIYYTGLDDDVISWTIKPRKAFENVQSKYPRRFQVTRGLSLGERQFARKCSVCHTLKPTGGNRAGPTLYRLFGRRAGAIPGYIYSDALKGSTIVWNAKTISELFYLGPEHYTPGTKMPLQRIKSALVRNALVAYLERATKSDNIDADGVQKGDTESARRDWPGLGARFSGRRQVDVLRRAG